MRRELAVHVSGDAYRTGEAIDRWLATTGQTIAHTDLVEVVAAERGRIVNGVTPTTPHQEWAGWVADAVWRRRLAAAHAALQTNPETATLVCQQVFELTPPQPADSLPESVRRPQTPLDLRRWLEGNATRYPPLFTATTYFPVFLDLGGRVFRKLIRLDVSRAGDAAGPFTPMVEPWTPLWPIAWETVRGSLCDTLGKNAPAGAYLFSFTPLNDSFEYTRFDLTSFGFAALLGTIAAGQGKELACVVSTGRLGEYGPDPVEGVEHKVRATADAVRDRRLPVTGRVKFFEPGAVTTPVEGTAEQVTQVPILSWDNFLGKHLPDLFATPFDEYVNDLGRHQGEDVPYHERWPTDHPHQIVVTEFDAHPIPLAFAEAVNASSTLEQARPVDRTVPFLLDLRMCDNRPPRSDRLHEWVAGGVRETARRLELRLPPKAARCPLDNRIDSRSRLTLVVYAGHSLEPGGVSYSDQTAMLKALVEYADGGQLGLVFVASDASHAGLIDRTVRGQ